MYIYDLELGTSTAIVMSVQQVADSFTLSMGISIFLFSMVLAFVLVYMN